MMNPILWWRLRQLKSKDWRMRLRVVQKLSKIKNVRVVDVFIVTLQDDNAYVREAAAQALGKIGNKIAIDSLIIALDDRHSKVQKSAADALIAIGDKQAIAPILKLLLKCYIELTWQPKIDLLDNLDKNWRISDDAKRIVPSLVKTLSESDERSRKLKIDLLNAIDKSWRNFAIESIIDALKNSNPYEYEKLASILKEIADSQTVNLLLGKLNRNETPYIIIFSLGVLGDTYAVPALISCLDNKDLRFRAAEALGKIGDQRAVPALISCLDNKDLRFRAAEALAKIGDQRGVPALISYLDNKDQRFSAAEAAETLGKIGDQRAVEPLLIASESQHVDLRRLAAEALGRIGDPRALDRLTTLLYDDKEVEVRRAAAKALERVGGLKGKPEELIIGLHDKREEVREASKYALIQVGRSALELLIRNLGDSNPSVSSAIQDCIISIGEDAVDSLINVLKNENQKARGKAARILGILASTRAIEPLLAFLDDSDPKLSFDCAYSLTQLGDIHGFPILLESLFLNPIESERYNVIRMLNSMRNPTKISMEMFVLIQHVSTYATESIDDRHTNLIPSYKEGMNALKKLCKIRGLVSENILHLVTRKKDIVISLPSCACRMEHSLDFSKERSMATEELKRRNSPKYDRRYFFENS